MLRKFVMRAIAIVSLTLAGCSQADRPDSANSASTPDTGTSAVLAEGHFHPKGKAPSEYTLAIFEEAQETLPFSDRQDFEEWERGFIAGREDLQIMADAGNVAWDIERYQFLNNPENINSVHPSLLRMGQLNMNYGL